MIGNWFFAVKSCFPVSVMIVVFGWKNGMKKETGGEKKDQMSGGMLSRSRFLACSRNSE